MSYGSGPESRAWKGSAIGYDGAHDRVYVTRGRAAEHRCLTCGNAADEWSYTHDDPDELVDELGRPYSADPGRYVPRCRRCHRWTDHAAARARAGQLSLLDAEW